MEAELKKSFQNIASGNDIDSLNNGGTPSKPCTLSIREDSISAAANFNSDCIQCVSESAASFFGSDSSSLTKEMVSGAGHDSVQTSYICPTTMIFIPCKDGVSHNPKEFSTAEDCAIGAQVLLGAVLRYDQLRAKKNSN
jgi:acetylornithine deacetylase/succinyl-diaminopimelate desuccinylase-like protein